ncbi:hypothetical protein HN419_04580 [Candidatus Woesearchaeota archaeon]|jgi:hypothetical protein|nr:hypothetical protein [Candidatus Woesearchaeota archaeon]MBT3537848.1 hypothetical protein [Candidatus Woesearchaeota archaeon]MBT4697979.1 hypothetical protein [Candidatus Woesearchaeota archaeon]MBT7105517.1 hypothetical protein [Candidatus Woesearchaeota archaeon]MBT7931707.1 hypothetical protein [Candidatus Woesearchaeota archaeon]
MKKVSMLVLFILVMSLGVLAQSTHTDSTAKTVLSLNLINQDPDPAIAGDIVEVRVGIENLGGKPSGAFLIELLEDYPFSSIVGEPLIQKVDSIDAHQSGDNSKIIKFKVRVDKDAVAAEYELKLLEYFEGKRDVSATQRSLSIDIKNRENAEVIHIDKTMLVPGKQSSLKFTINNVGNAPLRDLNFYWLNEDKVVLPVGSDNTKYIKYIEMGESAEMEYQVISDSNADPGLYELELYLSYDDPLSSEAKEVTTIAGVYVGGETDFDVAFSESSGGEASFSVANIGSNPAFSVSIVIPKQSNWQVTGSNSMIVGNLNKGDYTVASFTLQKAQSSASVEKTDDKTVSPKRARFGNVTNEDGLRIQVVYTDTRGERSTVEKVVNLNPSMLSGGMGAAFAGAARSGMAGRTTKTSMLSQYKWHIIFVILVVVLIVLRSKYKKMKMADPKFKLMDLFGLGKKRH